MYPRLPEGPGNYEALFEAENDDMGLENTCLWDLKAE
jgi:hypothetical protein